MRFALCDDNIEELERIGGQVADYLAGRPELDGSLRCFQSAYDLIDCIRGRGEFDAYLLDVMMPHMNGIELGRAIREAGGKAPIVYLTSSPDYAVESYRVRAYDYLLKPVDGDALAALMDKLTAELQAGRETPLLVRTREQVTPVYPGELCYVRVRDHVLEYHMADGRVVESGTLRESFAQTAAPLLGDGRFVKISVSHIVNMSFVQKLTGSSFTMRDGAVLRISRALASSVRETYVEYILERGKPSQTGI
ncbi:LytR/AlgR family response regulator transcription factor [Bacilliculturomica massiliensis]|uniref:LytR/AlgR family response regulator transcription factor n=1 Tax=Bacilliculturomica massiliensis TaxID=1917867 RepID=UPI0013EEF0A0|nr:LytTR family DNA-binding domain-containing protein [Bacilliculturomica massiliensis]